MGCVSFFSGALIAERQELLRVQPVQIITEDPDPADHQVQPPFDRKDEHAGQGMSWGKRVAVGSGMW